MGCSGNIQFSQNKKKEEIMGYSFERKGDIIIIKYSEEIIAEETSDIRKIITENKDIKKIVIDMRGVELITTPGLGSMLAIHKHCAELDKKMVVFGLSPYVKEIILLTRLVRVFDIRETEEEAMEF